jgi:choice-of-anchor B domain-containing protein
MSPASIDIGRDDTLLIRFTPLDESGSPIPIARLGLARASQIFDVRSLRDSIPNTYLLWGVRPVESQFVMMVQVPSDSGGFRWVTLDTVPVMVRDYPVHHVEITAPSHRPYAGTSFPMWARAATAKGERHASAAVTWRSSDPSIASVTSDGIVSFWQPGTVVLTAATDGNVSATHEFSVLANPVRQLKITPRTAETRTGDVLHLGVEALDAAGRPVEGVALSYAVQRMGSGAGARMYPDGAFVAEDPGAYKVLAAAGTIAGEAIVRVEPRPGRAPVRLLGRGVMAGFATSDLWVFTGKDGRDYAYTGTMPDNGGEHMFAWDVTDPTSIVKTDSVQIDARRVNDVKVNADASWAIITGENSSTRKNGITVLDLTDPAHPQVMAELTDGMTGGVHNVWINGTIVYVINDGTLAMDVVDMADPSAPERIGEWVLRPGDQNKYLHDVWSDGRYAYLSYWDDGVVILDVGAGTHGGTARVPTFVSSFAYPEGNTHVAWREGNYLFTGDEIFGCDECINGPRGYIHVLDVSDIEHPKEVAKYEVPEAGVHNIWVEDGTMYVAYYQGGLRVVDVTGELRGDLYRQGREIGWFHTAAREGEGMVPNSPMAWGPQPHKGSIFVSDNNSGLWVLKHERRGQPSP